MKLKKHISVLICAAVICSSLAINGVSTDFLKKNYITAKAISKYTIKVDDVQVLKGNNTVSIPVHISNNLGFAAIGIKYCFDKKIKSYDVSSGIIDKPVKSVSDGIVAVTSAYRENITKDGILYTLKFKIPDNISVGDSFTITAESDLLRDDMGNNIDVELYNGSITIVEDTNISTTTESKSLGDLNGDNSIDSKDAVIILKTYAESLVNSDTPVDLTGNINKDGKIDSKDAVIILKYYAATLTGYTGQITEFK